MIQSAVIVVVFVLTTRSSAMSGTRFDQEISGSEKWEQLNIRQRELRSKGAEFLHARVLLLTRIYDDPEFRAWCDSSRQNEVEWMDSELSDTGLDFFTLRAVLDAFPDVEQWMAGNIRTMVARVIADQTARRKRDPDTGEERMSWKERAIMAERECERLRAENQSLREMLGSIQAGRDAETNRSRNSKSKRQEAVQTA
jgi:hypothetical protein